MDVKVRGERSRGKRGDQEGDDGDEGADGEGKKEEFFGDGFRFLRVAFKVSGDEGGRGHEERVHEVGERPKDVQGYLVRGHDGIP